MTPLRTLIVDDTALYRKILSELLTEVPDLEVVATATNGKVGLDKSAALRPDIITLDIEMPDMNGIEVLRQLKQKGPLPFVIMVSSISRVGAEITMEALELGAMDFVTKPTGMGLEESRQELMRQFRPIFAAIRARATIRSAMPAAGATPCPAPKAQTSVPKKENAVDRLRQAASSMPPEIVAIAISTGGPQALNQMLPKLPGDLRIPIVIVQHIPATFSAALAESLNQKCALTVVEATDGQALSRGSVYIAPGGKQMKIQKSPNSGASVLKITDDPPENNCKPSADYLMRSVAQVYGNKALGVIMTGMGADGVTGLRLMKRHGITVIAQDENSSVVFGMPAEAIAAGVVDIIAPLDRIAIEIVKKASL